jgi:hypothetical protein
MRNITAPLFLCLAGLFSISSPALAQQKTAAACRSEWQANKADNKAKGITEKAYVAQCLAGGAGSSPTPSTTGASAPESSTAPATASASTQQKTAAACRSEWQANKADNKAKGITEKAYVAQCLAGGAGGTSAPPAATAAAPTPAKPTTTPAAPAPAAAKPAPTAAAAPTGAGEFTAEAEAKSHCPSDTVVWANLESKVYHFSGHKDYGNTKSGAYMCEKDAVTQGFRASKAEKHPT